MLLAQIRRRQISKVVLGSFYPRAGADALEGWDGVRGGVGGGEFGVSVVLGVKAGWRQMEAKRQQRRASTTSSWLYLTKSARVVKFQGLCDLRD